MTRRRSLEPSTHLHLRLAPDVRGQVDLHLYSELEGRVPQGAYQAFFEQLIRSFFNQRQLPLEPFGFPPGFWVSGPKEMVEILESRLKGEFLV